MPHLTNIESAAESTGLDPQEIEYAEEIGLLSAGREAEGMYSDRQMRTLNGIARLRKLGLSIDDVNDLGLSENVLSDVRDYLGPQTEPLPKLDISRKCLSATIQVLEGHALALSQQIKQLDTLRQSLDDRIEAFRKLLDAVEEKVRKAA